MFRVMMKIKVPGREGLDNSVHFEIPLYTASYETLEHAVEVINCVRQTVADTAITSYVVHQGTQYHPAILWHTLEYGEWSDLMRN